MKTRTCVDAPSGVVARLRVQLGDALLMRDVLSAEVAELRRRLADKESALASAHWAVTEKDRVIAQLLQERAKSSAESARALGRFDAGQFAAVSRVN